MGLVGGRGKRGVYMELWSLDDETMLMHLLASLSKIRVD